MKTALLVIDYINGIINGSCKNYATNHPIVSNTNKLIASCRVNEIPIFFVRLAYDANYSNLPKHSKGFNHIKDHRMFQLDGDNTNFVADLDYQDHDIIINKTAASPFHSENLTQLLTSSNIEKIIFAGVATDNAINIGAREANDAGYYTTIAEDACGASSEEYHHWSIKMLEKIVNEILSTEEIINQLNQEK